MAIRSFFDLDNSTKYIASAEVRLRCGWKKGDTTIWTKHRRLLGIKGQKLTKQEAFLLWVASQACKGVWHLKRVDIYKAAVELYRKQPEAASYKEAELEPELVNGAELMDVIFRETGIRRDITTMRRWGKKVGMPAFSTKSFYTRKQVSLYLWYARKRARHFDEAESI